MRQKKVWPTRFSRKFLNFNWKVKAQEQINQAIKSTRMLVGCPQDIFSENQNCFLVHLWRFEGVFWRRKMVIKINWNSYEEPCSTKMITRLNETSSHGYLAVGNTTLGVLINNVHLYILTRSEKKTYQILDLRLKVYTSIFSKVWTLAFGLEIKEMGLFNFQELNIEPKITLKWAWIYVRRWFSRCLCQNVNFSSRAWN